MFERDRHTPAAIPRARRLRTNMTWTEQRLWKDLRKLDAHIRRQAPIGRFVVDFACHAGKLVIEVDGGVHDRLEEVQLRDAERQAWLETQGYRVLRFADQQVRSDPWACAEEVRKALALPLDGEGLGWGVPADSEEARLPASAPCGANVSIASPPPHPNPSPSRGRASGEPS